MFPQVRRLDQVDAMARQQDHMGTVDLEQIRTQAAELKRAFQAGEADARARVLDFHPKFAGRPAQPTQDRPFTLRDAQATIARELGFDSWKVLLADVEDAPRWASGSSFDMHTRAFAEARDLRHRYCSSDHFLLALLNPPVPTVTTEVLAEFGVSHAKVRERVEKWMRPGRKSAGPSSTPAFQLTMGWAQGIAVGMGANELNDEHVLLALIYGDIVGDLLTVFDVDQDELLARLKARGVAMPRAKPTVLPTPLGPFGPWVYFPKEEWSAVTHELAKDFPSGTSHWGTNRSKWKQGHWYVHGEDDIPMEEIVRRAVKDGSAIELLSFEEGLALENATAPRRPRRKPAADESS